MKMRHAAKVEAVTGGVLAVAASGPRLVPRTATAAVSEVPVASVRGEETSVLPS